MQDFEGYRIHSANINQDNAYSLLAEFDKIDFAYFTPASATDGVTPMDQTTQSRALVAAGLLDSLSRA